MTLKKRVTKDFETRSEVDLKKAGAYKYSLHPSTRPTCFSFKIWDEGVVYFLPFHVINRPFKKQDEKLQDLWVRLIQNGYDFSAHNSFFERCIYDNILVPRYGWPKIPPRQRRCTAAKAAACALPRNLEGAGEAMRLSVQKDKRGYQAMMATCKPTRAYNAWVKARAEIAAGKKVGAKKRAIAESPAPPMFLEPDVGVEMFQTLYTYCKIDTKAEEHLDRSLPDLIPSEQEIWHFNQMLNWRGLRFDRPTVEKIVKIMADEKEEKTEQLDGLTAGLVKSAGAIRSILEFLEIEGVELPNLRAKTIDDAIKHFELSDNARELLELRKALSKASTRKYQTFLDRGVGDRIRDILLYHGASTGRDTGSGIQPHNFPRGMITKEAGELALEILQDDDIATIKEHLHFYFGDTLGVVFSSLLRNMIIPDDGYEMFVADFSKIEVAVLWWLAENKFGLKGLSGGEDPYILQAAFNTGKTYKEVDAAVKRDEQWATDARQLGKAQILGGGFGMGWLKFQKTAWDQYRLKLTDDQSKAAIKNYREAHAAVPELWKAYEAAAISAVENPNRKFLTNRCEFLSTKEFLWVKLPSGRRLAYRDPQMSWRETDYGPRKTLEFMGVDKSKKKVALERTWGGTLTENIVQAVARDLMMPAMVRLEKRGYQGVLMVHDEGITQRKIGEGSVEEFVKIMTEPPPWALGLPLEAKGWTGKRYRK